VQSDATPILVPPSIQRGWAKGGEAVTPAEALEKIAPRVARRLPADYAPDFIDEFVARNRTVLLALVDRALTTRRVKRGVLPRNAAEFAAYGKLVPRERARDAEPDDEVLRQLLEFTNSSEGQGPGGPGGRRLPLRPAARRGDGPAARGVGRGPHDAARSRRSSSSRPTRPSR
jgi:hypothetical protein